MTLVAPKRPTCLFVSTPSSSTFPVWTTQRDWLLNVAAYRRAVQPPCPSTTLVACVSRMLLKCPAIASIARQLAMVRRSGRGATRERCLASRLRARRGTGAGMRRCECGHGFYAHGLGGCQCGCTAVRGWLFSPDTPPDHPPTVVRLPDATAETAPPPSTVMVDLWSG